MCLRMGFTALRRIAQSLHWQFDLDPLPDDPIQLTYEEFVYAVHLVAETGFPIERATEEAWPNFRGWRVNYEALAYRMADRVIAPELPGPAGGATYPSSSCLRSGHRTATLRAGCSSTRNKGPIPHQSRPPLTPPARSRGTAGIGQRTPTPASPTFEVSDAGWHTWHRTRGGTPSMATVELDADFLALPLEGLRSAALDRAQALGCSTPKCASSGSARRSCGCATGTSRPPPTTSSSAWGLRVVHDGSFGFAATVELDRDAAAALAEEAVGNGRGDRACLPRARRAGRGAAARRGGLDLRLRDRPRRGAHRREGGAARGLERPPAAVAGGRPRDRLRARRRRGQALRRPRRHGHHPAPGAAPPGGRGASPSTPRPASFESMRTLAPPVGRGWEYLLGDGLGLGPASSRRIPELSRREARTPPRSTPAPTTWSSIPRTSGSRSTSRSATPPSSTGRWATRPPTPGPPSRPSTSSGTLRYGSEIMNVTGDRTRRARPGDRRLRRRGSRGADLRPHPRRRARRLPARPANRGGDWRSAGPTAAPSPIRRVHTPIQRMANVSLRPAPGRRPDDGGPHLLRRPRASTCSATRAGRSTCSGTTSSSPGNASSGSRTASSPGR